MDSFIPLDEPTVLRATFLLDQDLLSRSTAFFIRKEKLARSARIRCLLLACAGVLVLLLGALQEDSVRDLYLLVGGIAVFGGLAGVWKYPEQMRASWLKVSQRVPGLLGGHQIEVKPSTFIAATHRGQSLIRLDQLHAIDVLPDLIVVSYSTVQFLPIPADADFGNETFETFAAKLTALYADAQARGAKAKTAFRGV